MDRQQIELGLTLKALHLPGKMDSFENRLILQKAVYLAQEAGVHLGYYFSWYLYGPYCSALTNDAFAMNLESEEFRGWQLDESSNKKLNNLSELIHQKSNDLSKLARHLELLASVHFLIRRKQVSAEKPSEISSLLKKYQKSFEERDVQDALGELRKYELLG